MKEPTNIPIKRAYKNCEHLINKRNCRTCYPQHFCEHNKLKRFCKDCCGSAICQHNKIKYNCKECSGSSICVHGKQKYTCKDCGGFGVCEHGKQKYDCKECGGSRICKHNKYKYNCKECSSFAFCEHGKKKSECKECGGSRICEHNKLKRYCIDCGGSAICEHGKRKIYCKDCGGSGICEHNKQKQFCKECKGSHICEHNKLKKYCKECDGYSLCKSEWCEKIGNKKYEGYCLFCYVHLFPDKPITKNYKTKEKEVVNRILEIYPNFTWVSDKKIQDGCSRKRPDLLVDFGSHIIIVEVDENAHSTYDCSCENKRLMELSQDVGHRPIVFIRFNPDEYIDQDGNKIKSCWKINKTTGLMTIDSNKKLEWEERINILLEQIKYWSENKSEKIIEIIELFY